MGITEIRVDESLLKVEILPPGRNSGEGSGRAEDAPRRGEVSCSAENKYVVRACDDCFQLRFCMFCLC